MGNRRKGEMSPEELAAMEQRVVARLKAGVSQEMLMTSTGLSRNRIREIAHRHNVDTTDLSKRRRRAAWA
jgi:hypothetical protein